MYTARVKPVFGNLELGSIRRVDIESFMGKCKSEGLAPATIRHFLSILSAVYHKMRVWEMYDGPIPTEAIPKPRQDNRRMRFFTREQIDELLPAVKAKSKQLHDIVKLSLHTGMRAKEIFSLMGEHIDLKQGTVRVVDPKDISSSDVIPLTKTAKKILAEQDPQPGVLVFRNRTGGKIESVSDTFKRIVERLGFNNGMDDRRDKLVFHSLRHTFASWMAINGESIYTIQQLMRHKSAQMTQRYSHLSNSAKIEAMDRFEELFSGKSEAKGKVSGKRRAKAGQ